MCQLGLHKNTAAYTLPNRITAVQVSDTTKDDQGKDVGAKIKFQSISDSKLHIGNWGLKTVSVFLRQITEG